MPISQRRSPRPLGLLKEIMPSITRVALIFDPKVAPGGGSYYTNLIESAAPSFAVAPTAVPVHNAVDIEGAIGDFVNKPNGGLLVLPDATTNLYRELIIALAARYRVPDPDRPASCSRALSIFRRHRIG